MLIDIPNHDKIAEHARKIANAREDVRHYEEMDKHSFHGFDRVYEKRNQLEHLKSVVIPPKTTLFVPGKPTKRQQHALTGSKWTHGDSKPTFEQQLRFVLAAFIAGGCGTASLAFKITYPWPEASRVCGILALLGVAVFIAESRTIRAWFHNYRIARVNVNAVTSYDINGRLTASLRLKLGGKNWQRLIDGIKAGDPELEIAFEKYCKGSEWHIDKRDRADDNYDIDQSELNSQLQSIAIAGANTFNSVAAAAISGLFAARDAEELKVKQALKEAASQLKSDEAQRKLLASAHDSGVLEVELKYQKPVFEL